MAQSIIDILLRTMKSGDGDKQVVGSLTELKSGLDLIRNAYSSVASVAQAFYSQTVTAAVAYNKSIRDTAQNLGIGTEETSRIVQGFDDLGVSAESMGSAMEMMTKRGVAPSVEALAQIADQYVAIQDPLQRAAMMTELLGRNWTALTPALKMGGDAIREAAAGVSGSLVVTQEAEAASRKYEIALDNLGDAWTELNIKFGNAAIPTVTGMMNFMSSGANKTGDFYADQLAYLKRIKEEQDKLNAPAPMVVNPISPQGYTTPPSAGVSPQGFGSNAYADLLVKQAKEAAAAELKLKTGMGELQLFMAGPIGKATEQYTKQNYDLEASLTAAKQKLDDLQKTPWKTADIKQARSDIVEITRTIETTNKQQEESGKQILFDMAKAQMELGGLTQEESDQLMALGEKLGLIDEPTKQMYDDIQKSIGALSTGVTTTDQWTAAMQRLATDWYVTVHYTYDGKMPDNVGNNPPPVVKKPWVEHASGGPVSVGTTYLVGEQGPELFVSDSNGTIIPNNQLRRGRGGAGGAGNTYVLYNPKFNLDSQNTFSQLMDEIAKGRS
jgi:hypothetical protein